MPRGGPHDLSRPRGVLGMVAKNRFLLKLRAEFSASPPCWPKSPPPASDGSVLTGRPGERPAAHQMKVDVEHELMCVLAHVHGRSPALAVDPALLRDPCGHPHQLPG